MAFIIKRTIKGANGSGNLPRLFDGRNGGFIYVIGSDNAEEFDSKAKANIQADKLARQKGAEGFKFKVMSV